MPTIIIPTFAGEIPKTTPRLLETQQAAKAVNCNLERGALQAMRAPGLVKGISGTAKTIFKHDRDGWLTWDKRVSVVKSAAIDADGENPLGQLLITGDRDYPTMYLAGGEIYRLGIPRPTVAPSAKIQADTALADVDAWVFAVDSLDAAPARYGYEGAEVRASEGSRLSYYSARTLPGPGSDGGAASVMALAADAAAAFSITTTRPSSTGAMAILTGSFALPLTVEYFAGGQWRTASDMVTTSSNALSFSVAEDATQVRVTDSKGATATANLSSAPSGGDSGGGSQGGSSGGESGESADCSGLNFDRSATLEAKSKQMNDTAFNGRSDWNAEEAAACIVEAGFDSVEDWWEEFGRDEGVCPWDSVSCCKKAGYTYYAGGAFQSIARSSAYCYTLVQSLAGGVIQYESAPSPASMVVDVPHGDGVVLSGFDIPSLPGLKITHIRIYRTVSGTESSNFRFLAELSLRELDAAGRIYVDSLHDRDVSTEILQTSTWDAIPNNAKGLIKTDNGIYAAFRGNELLLSEPFHPYAFPASYALTVEDCIVALAHVDSTIVVLTTGRPYLAQGTAPENLALVHLPIEQACVSALSVATLPGGVMYASPDGLMLFSSNEQGLATSGTFTREQWQSLGPDRLMGTVHDGRYVAFFEGTSTGLLFHIGRADVVRMELPDGWKVQALYHHSEDDALYLSAVTPDGCGIWQFEGGNALLPYRWRSKDFFTSALCSMAAARVQGAQSVRNPVRMDIFGPDGKRARTSMRLTGGKTVRLRTTRAERLWSFALSGTADVYEARMGSSVEGVEHGI